MVPRVSLNKVDLLPFECCKPKYSDSRERENDRFGCLSWGCTLFHLVLVERKMEILFDCQADVPDVSLPFTASTAPVSSTSCVASRLFCETKFVSFSSDQGHLVYLLYCFGSCLSWLSLDLPNSLCLLFKGSLKEVSTANICSNIVQCLN